MWLVQTNRDQIIQWCVEACGSIVTNGKEGKPWGGSGKNTLTIKMTRRKSPLPSYGHNCEGQDAWAVQILKMREDMPGTQKNISKNREQEDGKSLNPC
jgi:hypothetical protein